MKRLSHLLIYTFSFVFFSPLFLTGISSVLFESRIGCLDPVVPEETERFIQSINTMFVMTLLTMAMPSWLHQLFPKPWNIFCQCWDYMFDFGRQFILKIYLRENVHYILRKTGTLTVIRR